MSENKNQNEILKNQTVKKDDSQRAESLKGLKENDSEHNKHSIFKIGVSDLENLMGFYKERGSDYLDLKYIKEKLNGSEGLLQKLDTDSVKGVSSLVHREEEFGSNKVFVEPVPPFCSYVWEALEDLMIRILIVSAIVSIVLGCTLSDDPSKDWIDGLSIIIAVIVVVLVGSITNYQKETKFHELNDIQNEGTKYTLTRNGKPEEHISDDILVGDLINVNYGDIMPADLFLIEGNGIKMDEAALTGESDAMKKETYERCMEIKSKSPNKVPSPLILSGTNCIEGSGKAIVVAVGDHSQKGIIRRTVDNAQENSQTPLEKKLDNIAEMIGWFGMGAGIVTFVALLIRFGIKYAKDEKNYRNESKVDSVMTGFAMNSPADVNNPKVYGNINNELTNPKSLVAKKILDIIILCISIIVVAIPEGLPLAVTLSLAFSIKKMMDLNNLVRKMHACETMGGANYICTDKTGTLTRNEMSVNQILTGDCKKMPLAQNIDVEGVGNVDKTKAKNEDKQIREDYTTKFKNEKFWNILKTALALNVECSIKKLDKANINGDTEIAETKNKTDKAFIDFLYRFKSPISIEHDKYLSSPDNYKQFPFDSKRKRMTTFIKNDSFPTKFRLFSKGGAENATKYCTRYLDPETGDIKNLDEEKRKFIDNTIEEFNKDKLRSLYVCYNDINENDFNNCEHPNGEGQLIDQYNNIFLTVFGIKDALRDGVTIAVKKCHEASVKVIMVTGDNIVTATAIAKECTILDETVDLKNLSKKDIEFNPEEINDKSKKDAHIKELLDNCPKAMTGNSFYNAIGGLICETCELDTNACKCPKTEAEAKQMAEKEGTEQKPIKKDVIKDMDAFKKLIENLLVMARSQPIHKYSLVLGLKSLGSVVAVTGDGTNDAPALSKSDVGFAMFAGTDIAKEASDIIIIDNNFSSIVIAIIYGRNIYDNIRKFLQFQLSVNFCACLLVFICACIGNETPLKPIQMLWVNLIMDSLGSLALATEPPYDELLQREPTKRNESIISALMWKHISIQSLIQLILLIVMFLIAPEFMKEQDVVRLTENYIILDCYGELPGGKTNPDYIIYGPESKWGTTKLAIGANEERCGNYADRQDLSVAYKEYQDSQGGTVHMTLIFTIFVFYTLFNQFNCRIINDQFNIFVRITRSLLFPLITFFEMALQVILVQFGNTVFHCCERGLTGKQWGICIGFSAITFVVSFICKLIPLENCIQPILDKFSGDDDDEDEEGEGEGEQKKIHEKDKNINKKNNNSNFESIDSSIKIKINKNADREIYNMVESDSSKENNQIPQSNNKLKVREKNESPLIS